MNFEPLPPQLSHVESLLRDLLHQAGLAMDGWDTDIINQRNLANDRRIIARVHRPGQDDLVFKAIIEPRNSQEFQNSFGQQMELQDRLPGVAKIRAYDLRQQAYLMDCLPGTPLHELCAVTEPQEHPPMLKAAGAWLAMVHRVDGIEERRFKPRYMLNHYDKVCEKIRSGQKQVANPRQFLEFAQRLPDFAPKGPDRQTIAGRSHGDASCHNILIDQDVAYGLDFMGKKVRPVGHDIAHLLVHYAIWRPELSQAQGVLPGADVSGFFEGYDVVGPDDKTVAFLMKCRLLKTWLKTATHEADRSIDAQIRYNAIRRLARRVFE